jgi:predicted metalloprotease with PDZ domain
MKLILAVTTFLLIGISGLGQKLAYTVSFPNAVHHEGQFELTATDFPDQTLVFRMSRSSPGRYATHEFGKNVYDVKAYNRSGKQIQVDRVDGDVYQVANPDRFVRLEYTLFANHPDGTYAGIDRDGIHLNIPAAFMWLKGAEKTPVEVNFRIPSDKNWSIATQLFPGKDRYTFTAPDLQYFMDSPVKIGNMSLHSWQFPGHDVAIGLALEADTSEASGGAFSEKIKRLSREMMEVFGEFPAFENGRYTFLAGISPYVKGDGMEHRNSTVIHLPAKFNGGDHLLGVFSHEFFHAWNVERIRPRSLEPFNYEKSNMSQELWFAEGFTQYYGDLILKRANFTSFEEYAGRVSSLINTKNNTPGALKISPMEASCMAVFVDAGVSVDKTNYGNTFTSYYPYGAAIALALDLELRERGLSLDRFMQTLWRKHGKTEIPYDVADLQTVLEEVTRDTVFAARFFRKYIYGHDVFDYQPLLEKAGLQLKKPLAGKAWLGGIQWRDQKSLVVATNTTVNTPIYLAGVDVDDALLRLNGLVVNNPESVDAALRRHRPGDEMIIEYAHRGRTLSSTVKLAENPHMVVETYEKLNLPLTPAIREFRKQWLETKVDPGK